MEGTVGPQTAARLPVLALLAFLSAGRVCAMSAALPPPCPASFDSESVARLAGQIRSVGQDDWANSWTADCASKALSRKGAGAVPALQSLMATHLGGVESDALSAVCGLGESGAGKRG